VITHVDTKDPLIALTFDDGPDPESTIPLLEVLEGHGARGTFFLRGAAAARHPEVVRRIVAGGHAIGNHTWSHPVLPRIGFRRRVQELRSCEAALAPYGAGKLFRPPYLAFSRRARLEAFLLGLEVIMCNVSTDDWRLTRADEILAVLLKRPSGGDIVLLHDTVYVRNDVSVNPSQPPFPDRGPMRAAVEAYLTETEGRFRHVTVPDLLRAGRPVRKDWYMVGPAVRSDVRIIE
jgi:peptidoglycan-N-acetylglucosamine deacetylase